MSDENNNADLSHPIEQRFNRLTKPFDRFVKSQTSAAVLLLFATIAALIIANSPFQDFYHQLEEVELGLFFSDFELRKTLHHWVNDGLMVLFFFLLGLEIKREFIAGELQSFSQSSTVILAALGGMIFPALIYAAFNFNTETAHGWGIPMATDAAFALGALVLLGKRIPSGLKVFLVALAIVDDIGAIIVIALFYTEQLNLQLVIVAGALFALMMAMNRLGIRKPLPYLMVSIALWYATLTSGVHATVAGVLAAFAIPARPRLHPQSLAKKLRYAAKEMDQIEENPVTEMLANEQKHEVVETVEQRAKETKTPLRSWETTLERPVSLLVIPIFAFLNAGILISMESLNAIFSTSISWGIIAGLVLGKPLGIVLMTWIALKLKWGKLPDNVNLLHIVGVGLLAGMGFTMSIFIGSLSLVTQPELLNQAKMSIMLATTVAGVLGILWLWFLSQKKKRYKLNN